MIADFLKRNNIILVFSAICLGLLALVLLQLDKQYYQNAKKALILSEYIHNAVGEEQDNLILNRALAYLRTPTKQAREELVREAGKVLDGPGIVWRIAVWPVEPETAAGQGEASLDLARRDKLRRCNNFSNSLFLRNFSAVLTRPLQESDPAAPAGRIAYYYTTPLESRQIRELTTLYRWYSFFIVLGALGLAFTVARRLLYPIRNVSAAIDGSTAARTSFIARPHSRLESLYNRMALDAVLARLQGQMREEIARRPQMTGWEVVQRVCAAFAEQLAPALAACVEMVAEGPGRIRATGQGRVFGAGLCRPEAELLERLDGLLPRDGRNEAEFALADLDPPIEGAMALVPDPERSGIRYLFALGLDARAHAHESPALAVRPTLERLSGLVETGLQTLSLRNQILIQERGRANISLSRNLGHDLTNIIATSKLDLMALERLLGDGRPPEDPRRRGILVESLRGLLRSIRFMQETVNLYRSYAFLQHPKLETQDGNELVAATLDLFAMSISARVELRRELAGEAPRCLVDPRLVKLALFNLFANALEAIRKADPDADSRGWIRVATARGENGGLVIAVEDSGTGILNGAGRRAENHEIEKIFELGYTSQRVGGGHGEGLGLNWVRTIVQDLHGGTIVAENVEGGGARFVMNFPPLG